MKTIISTLAAFLCTSVLVLGANHLAVADGDPAAAIPTATPSASETAPNGPTATPLPNGTPTEPQTVTATLAVPDDPAAPTADQDPLTIEEQQLLHPAPWGADLGAVQLVAPSTVQTHPGVVSASGLEQQGGREYAVVRLTDGSAWAGRVLDDHMRINGQNVLVW